MQLSGEARGLGHAGHDPGQGCVVDLAGQHPIEQGRGHGGTGCALACDAGTRGLEVGLGVAQIGDGDPVGFIGAAAEIVAAEDEGTQVWWWRSPARGIGCGDDEQRVRVATERALLDIEAIAAVEQSRHRGDGDVAVVGRIGQRDLGLAALVTNPECAGV